MNMKHFLKGVAAIAIVMFVVIAIHIIFYMNGAEPPINDLVEILLAMCFGTFIYNRLIKNEQNTDKED